MLINIEINDKSIVVRSDSELENILEESRSNKFNEIWISGHAETSLLLLTNPKYALLLFLREEGDSGFCSESVGAVDNRQESFYLSNGQLDEYPVKMLVQLEEGYAALIHYYHSGTMSSEISWVKKI